MSIIAQRMSLAVQFAFILARSFAHPVPFDNCGTVPSTTLITDCGDPLALDEAANHLTFRISGVCDFEKRLMGLDQAKSIVFEMPELLALPELPSSVSSLHASRCTKLSNVESIVAMTQLTFLMLDWNSVDYLPSLSALTVLTHLDLTGTLIKSLPELPSSLTILRAAHCPNLIDLKAIGSLSNLLNLDLGHLGDRQLLLSAVHHVADTVRDSLFQSVRSVIIDECAQLSIVPQLPDLVSLMIVNSCSYEDISSSISSVPCLESLTIIGQDFKVLPSLPMTLTSLSIKNCLEVVDVSAIESLVLLKDLQFSNSLIESLPLSPSVEVLNLRNCPNLKDISTIKSMSVLKHLRLSGLEIESLPFFPSVKSLRLHNCRNLKDISTITSMAFLRQLKLSDLEIKSLPHSSSLERLIVQKCANLKSIQSITGMSNLKDLSLSEIRIKVLPLAESVTSLRIHNCARMLDINKISKMKYLTTLELSGMMIYQLPKAPSVERLSLHHCPFLLFFESITPMTFLKSLQLSDLHIRVLPHAPSLEVLRVRNCPNLHDVQSVGRIARLKTLMFEGCPKLNDISSVEGLRFLTELDLKELPIVEMPDIVGRSEVYVRIISCHELTNLNQLLPYTKVSERIAVPLLTVEVTNCHGLIPPIVSSSSRIL